MAQTGICMEQGVVGKLQERSCSQRKSFTKVAVFDIGRVAKVFDLRGKLLRKSFADFLGVVRGGVVEHDAFNFIAFREYFQ